MASHATQPMRAAALNAQRHLRVVNATGLHLRAAAEIVKALRPFIADITLDHLGERADARSIMSLVCLAVPAGAMVYVRATGPDAQPALEEMVALFASGFGEGSGSVGQDEVNPWQGGFSENEEGAEGTPSSLQLQAC